MKYEINIRFENCKRAWTGEDIAADNDCAVYPIDEADLNEQIAKAKKSIKNNPSAKVEIEPIEEKIMKEIWFKKDGSNTWKLERTLNLEEFNIVYSDWISRYNPDGSRCENWDEALEVLNSVGASVRAGWFEIRD